MTDDGDEISSEVLHDLLENGKEVRVIDIRSSGEFDRGAIPGSENIPFQELPQKIEGLADEENVVTVCPHGKASLQAVRIIDSYEGTTGSVRSLEGGIDAWTREYELEASEETETEADAPF